MYCHILQGLNFLQSLDLCTTDNRILKYKAKLKLCKHLIKPACIDNALCIHAATQTQKPAQPNEVDQINATEFFLKTKIHKEIEKYIAKLCCGVKPETSMVFCEGAPFNDFDQ